MQVKVEIVHRTTTRGSEPSAMVHAAGCGDVPKDARRHGGFVRESEVPGGYYELLKWAASAWFGPDAYENGEMPDLGVASCCKSSFTKPKSIIVDWLKGDGLVRQDVVRLPRQTTPEQAVAGFAADSGASKVIGWRAW